MHISQTFRIPDQDVIDDEEDLRNEQLMKEHFSLHSHNGTITVENPATGNHRTFQVKTQKDDAEFAPGQRIVSLLAGPNNESDFQSFGFVMDSGRIIVWKRHRNTQFDLLARMLENLNEHVAAGRVRVHIEGKCRRCNLKLTTPESIRRGIGPVCAKKEL